jgi:hypothetical protein
MFERAKTVHASDRAATVIGSLVLLLLLQLDDVGQLFPQDKVPASKCSSER